MQRCACLCSLTLADCAKILLFDDMEAHMSILRDIIYGITAHGADFKTTCERLGIDPRQLNDSERMASFEPAAEVWNVAIELTGDELIGIHLGEELSATILGMIGYLMQSSKNLREAFVMLSKYNELFSTMMKFSLIEDKEECAIHYEPALRWQHEYAESARQSVEIGMSGTLKIFNILSGKKVFPVRVELAYPPRQVSEYERIFKCPIHFNAAQNRLVFGKDNLLQPVISHDKSLFHFFNNTLDQKLAVLKQESTLSNELCQLIIRDFKGRTPPAEVAAVHLNISLRSMQRRLKQENTSYREITQSIRKMLAASMMKGAKYRVSEVAEILGYSDSSSFHKAMKKWGG
jgi:AraC-like DNA-binding protein